MIVKHSSLFVIKFHAKTNVKIRYKYNTSAVETQYQWFPQQATLD